MILVSGISRKSSSSVHMHAPTRRAQQAIRTSASGTIRPVRSSCQTVRSTSHRPRWHDVGSIPRARGSDPLPPGLGGCSHCYRRERGLRAWGGWHIHHARGRKVVSGIEEPLEFSGRLSQSGLERFTEGSSPDVLPKDQIDRRGLRRCATDIIARARAEPRRSRWSASRLQPYRWSPVLVRDIGPHTDRLPRPRL